MAPTDITVEILKSIRDEVKSVRDELRSTRDALGERIDQTNERLDRLWNRQTESDIRLHTAFVELNRTLGAIQGTLAAGADIRGRVDDHERRIARLEHHEPR